MQAAILLQGRSLIAMSQELKAANVRKNLSSTRLGRSLAFADPGDAYAFFDSAVVGSGNYGKNFVGQEARMVSVTADDEISNAPGSWAISFSTREILVGSQSPDDVRASNLVAKINFGSGGTSHYVEIDANYGTVILPAQTVWVDVGQEPFMPDDTYAYPTPNRFMQSITSVVTACKSSQSCGEARRSYWVGGAAGSLVPIPPFAIAWAYMPIAPVTSGSLPATVSVLSASADTLDEPIPELVESMARTHCFRELPPNSEGGTISILPASASFGGQIVFKLLLGNP